MKALKKTGWPAKQLTTRQAQKVEVLAGVLTQAQIGAYFGFTDKTFRAIMDRQDEVSTAYKIGKAKTIAKIGSNLVAKALEGNLAAMIFYLKTQGGWSETNKLEISESIERPTIIKLVAPDVDENGKLISDNEDKS